MKIPTYSPGRRQRGAALVIGLILLVILTLLAISGMNTSSTELVMAGNEQYRLNAAQASATGVEEALPALSTVPQTAVPVVVGPANVPGSASDQYQTSSQYMGDSTVADGYSFKKFVTYHYEITSTGTSSRNAQAVTTQGAYVIQAGAKAP